MELYGVKQDHYKGSYQHRESCTVCWLILEVERLKDEVARLNHEDEGLKEQLRGKLGGVRDQADRDYARTKELSSLLAEVERLEGVLSDIGVKYANEIMVTVKFRKALEDARLLAVNHSFTIIIERIDKALKGGE